MNKMEAYSKLFSIDDSDLNKKYYIRLLSKSENEVPQEVIDYLDSFDSVVEKNDEIEDTEEVIENEVVILDNDKSDGTVVENDVPIVTETELDSDTVVIEEQQPDSDDSITVPTTEIESQVKEVSDENTTDEVVEVEDESVVVDPTDILKDFYDHLKKASVYRKIRNSDNPDSLCKSVSSFCTRYLIELHSSGFDSEVVRVTISEKVNVGSILRLLADYVEYGDLNSLAKSVVIIRNFLDKMDKEFSEITD